MEIKPLEVTVGDIYEGYYDDGEGGVRGYDGRLDIRPPYQREFVYDNTQSKDVIRSVLNGWPLNVMYWYTVNNDDEVDYQILDGQQRTISICQYIDGDYHLDNIYFHNQPKDIQKRILDYKLLVYACEGEPSERLDWFRIINIAGEKLTEQELRNAIYAGPWVSDAKRYFSKTNGPCIGYGGDYVTGTPIRQDVLETAIKWITSESDLTIDEYMGIHQADRTAVELWNYFRSVIDWVQAIFPHYRKIMKGLPWGVWYNRYHTEDLDPAYLESRISELIADREVTSNKGVYEYLLTGNEKALSLRAFEADDALTAYEQQKGICKICGKHFEFEQMQADHIVPWSKGGKTTFDNLQMLCRACNLMKSNQ